MTTLGIPMTALGILCGILIVLLWAVVTEKVGHDEW